jgi:hypothetical protein
MNCKYGTLCSRVVLFSPLAFSLSWPQLPTSSFAHTEPENNLRYVLDAPAQKQIKHESGPPPIFLRVLNIGINYYYIMCDHSTLTQATRSHAVWFCGT